MRKKIILLLTPLLLALFPLSGTVHAASVYDGAYHTTDNLIVSNNGHTQDVSNSWYTTIKNIPNNRAYGVSGCWEKNGKVGANEAIADIDAQHSYIVTQIENTDGSKYVLVYTAKDDTPLQLQWNNYSGGRNVTSSQTWDRSYVLLSMNSSGEFTTNLTCPNVTPQVSFDPTSTAWPDNKWTNFLAVNVDPNYPPDYAGTPIRDTYQPKTSLYPQITYSVEDKTITARYSGSEPCIKWLKWTVQNSAGTLGTPQTLATSDEFKYTVNSGYQEYWLYADPTGVMLPSGNTCGDEYQLQVMSLKLNIDGSSFTGSTDNLECSDSPDGSATFCMPPPQYEDCSVYGVDIVGGIGCAFNNFGVLLKSLLTTLFLPKPGDMSVIFGRFETLLTEKLGFLWYPFDFVIQSLNALVASGTYNCQLFPSAQFFGGNFNPNMCYVEQRWPSLWLLLQNVARAVLLVTLISLFYKKYKEVTDP